MYSSTDALVTLLKSRHPGNTGDLWWFSLFLLGSGSDKKSLLTDSRYFFPKEKKRTVLSGGIRN